MKDNLSIMITMLIFVILIVIFPLYNYFEREDDMSYNLVLKATTNFTDQVLNSGYMTQEMYSKYADLLSDTGNLYDIQIEAHRKLLVPDQINNEIYDEQYRVEYNQDIFSTDTGNINTNADSLQDKTINDGAYYLNQGDQFYIKVTNSNTTMAGAIFNAIVPTASKDRIKVNYGGVVKYEAWNKVDETYELSEDEYKLTLGDNFKNKDKVDKITYNEEEVDYGGVIARGYSRTITTIDLSNLKCEINDNEFELKGWKLNDTADTDLLPNTLTIDKDLTIVPVISEKEKITVTVKSSIDNRKIEMDIISGGEKMVGTPTKRKNSVEYKFYPNPDTKIKIRPLELEEFHEFTWKPGDYIKYSENTIEITCDENKTIEYELKFNYKAIDSIVLKWEKYFYNDPKCEYVRGGYIEKQYPGYHYFYCLVYALPRGMQELPGENEGIIYIEPFVKFKEGTRSR